tara:strand:+ start:681 stop:887 length:207 start_codon:yes stop_codon:yes gene_type:complete
MIDIKIIALLTPEGFDERFWSEASNTKTYKQAYENVEKDFEKYFQRRKYSDYNSYRNCRDKRIKKNKK